MEGLETSPSHAPTLEKRLRRLRRSVIFLAIVSVLAILVAWYYYRQYAALQSNSVAVTQSETVRLLAEVGQLTVLPETEAPTIVTVSNVEALKGQKFFAKAQNGFKMLIYANAKKAILYDPDAHKIVEISPINFGANPEFAAGVTGLGSAASGTQGSKSSTIK